MGGIYIMRFRFLTAAGAAALALAGSAADAAVTFRFADVALTLQNGQAAGSLTGTFTTDDALASIVDFDITTSTAVTGGFFDFARYNYTTANARVSAATLPSQFFRLNSTSTFGPELQIYFGSPLTVNGTTLNATASYENQFLVGNRLASGSIVNAAAAVPEPASWAMMMTGFALVAGTVRYRRRRNIVAIA